MKIEIEVKQIDDKNCNIKMLRYDKDSSELEEKVGNYLSVMISDYLSKMCNKKKKEGNKNGK